MPDQDYTTELLNLEDVNVTKIENFSQELHVYLELPKKTHTCPACGASTSLVHDYRMQIVKDLPLAKYTFLHLRKRRYRCCCGKRFFEDVPFLPRYYRVTSRLAAKLCFENAVVVADRYHVIRQVYWAMERVRKNEQNKLSTRFRKYFCT